MTSIFPTIAVILFWPPLVNGDIGFKKPYTIRIPFMAPISGPIMALGPVCTIGLEMVVNATNAQSSVLPNYNVMFDVYDDTCRDFVGVQQITSFYSTLLQRPVTKLNDVFGSFTIPDAGTMIDKMIDNATAVMPPLFIGGICSAVCKASSRLMAEFGLINIAYGCNDPGITKDKARYRNLYRFLTSLDKFAAARVRFAVSMGWKRVAVIADGSQYSLWDTIGLLQQLQSVGIDIVGEEFYLDDATEAVGRLKETGARIFFANCYANVCTTVACAAYAADLFGPKYVWIFKPDVDLSSSGLKRPSGCSEKMTRAFAERTFYIGADVVGDAYVNSTNEIGIAYQQFRDQLDARVPGVRNWPAWAWRPDCIEIAHVGVNIIDGVEKMLNSKYNKTLMDYYTNENNSSASISKKRAELLELVREATLKIDVRGLVGRSVLENPPADNEPIYPLMVVNQIQNSVRQMAVSFERSYNEFDRQMKPPSYNVTKMLVHRPFIWATNNGQPPKSQSAILTAERHVHPALIAVSWIVAGFIVILLILFFYFTVKLCDCHVFSKVKCCLYIFVLAGMCCFVVSIYLFPTYFEPVAMESFCSSVPFMVVVGYTLTTAPLVANVAIVYLERFHHISNKSATLVSMSGFGIWFVFNLITAIVWYTANPPFGTIFTVLLVNSEQDVDIYEKWLQCSIGKDPIYVAVIIGAQTLLLLTGVVMGLLSQSSSSTNGSNNNTKKMVNSMHKHSRQGWSTSSLPGSRGTAQTAQTASSAVSSTITTLQLPAATDPAEVRDSKNSLFIVLPLSIATLLALIVNIQMDIKYGLVTLFCLAKCSAVLAMLFGAKCMIFLKGGNSSTGAAVLPVNDNAPTSHQSLSKLSSN